ncbi:MAG: hypothetical protein M5U12_33890 [Verrucomicrobia bacterium]|nr:hypothetical protein [Verrucomicrobiota bacterium]
MGPASARTGSRGLHRHSPSGKLRDLARELPHIFDTLGCRILHLLPVNPTPTTYARFGRFGSPYAGQDLLAIDPALVEFDKRTTGVDQFRELAYGVHARGGRLFLDMAVNHTGWGSTLLENHPEWFRRENGGVRQPRRVGHGLGRPRRTGPPPRGPAPHLGRGLRRMVPPRRRWLPL